MPHSSQNNLSKIVKLEWSEAISIDNARIDHQHKRLIAITNNLIEHSNAKANSEIISETLQELLKYTREHFHDEEALMESLHYPKLAEHKKIHEAFVQKMAEFCYQVTENEKTVTEELLNFLVNWLLVHTREDDQDYKNYI